MNGPNTSARGEHVEASVAWYVTSGEAKLQDELQSLQVRVVDKNLKLFFKRLMRPRILLLMLVVVLWQHLMKLVKLVLILCIK